jgi:predicted TIM-barrel fold metal-dependent hydrolase
MCPEKDFGIGVNGIIEEMVNGAGSEKILFGTDLPWYSPHYAAGAVLYSRISEEDIHNIFHRNAERIFQQQGITL